MMETNHKVRNVLLGIVLLGTGFSQGAGASDKALFVTASGNVGIGTGNPTERLHIVGDGSLELKVRIEQSSSNAWAYSLVNGDPARPNSFRISKQGSGGPEVDIISRFDPSGEPTMKVAGSISATNVVFSSSRVRKANFQAVDDKELLQKLSELEISSWEYKEGAPGRHIGPVAEEFEATFNLGTNGKTISVVDTNGIALAAIKALHAEVVARDKVIHHLATQMEELRAQMDALSQR